MEEEDEKQNISLDSWLTESSTAMLLHYYATVQRLVRLRTPDEVSGDYYASPNLQARRQMSGQATLQEENVWFLHMRCLCSLSP